VIAHDDTAKPEERGNSKRYPKGSSRNENKDQNKEGDRNGEEGDC